jgi:SAM-dependent methyltransferase
MKPSIHWAVRACLLYNRFFRFRARLDPHIRECMAAEQRRTEDARAEALRYAEVEHAKTPKLMAKFGGIGLAGKRVLDFGCRYGGASLWFAEQGAASVVGVDVVEEMLETAREFVQARATAEQRSLPPIEFRLGSASRVPVEDGVVDLILSEDVVEHLQDPEAIFREWHRVLVPGGLVALSFGPLWYHPHGVHLWEVFPAPWTHLLFSERTCVRTRNLLKNEPSLGDRWTDMNKMTLARFKRLVKQSAFTTRSFHAHAVWGMKPFLLVPGLREFFVSTIDCVLEK